MYSILKRFCIDIFSSLQANLAREQAKLDKAQAEYQGAMDLLRSKEEEVRACTEEYEIAMAAKQVKGHLNTANHTQSIKLSNNPRS